MKTHRFFVDQNTKLSGEVSITDRELIHQIKDVLRLKVGMSVIFLNRDGKEFHGELTLVSKDGIKASEISIKKSSNFPKLNVKLYFSMIKKDKAEWVLQKCTELGVSEFHPVISERTEKSKINFDRVEKIIREAAEQSERSDLPILFEPIELEQALEECETEKIVLHMEGQKIDVSQLKEQESLAIFIGPEGGWGNKDLELFKKHDVKIVSLGENVLRAETASIAVSSLILLNK